MKKKLIKNKLYILSLILLSSFVILGLVITVENNQFLKEYDAITILFYALMNGKGLEYMSLLAPLIIFIVSSYHFHKSLRTGNIKYKITREPYIKCLKKSIFKSYLYATILVIAVFILFLGCCVINNKFNFDNAMPKLLEETIAGEPTYSATPSMINIKFYSTPVLLMFTFFFVTFLHSIFYANIGLIMCKKNKSFIISVVSSFLVFMGICIVSGVIEKYIVNTYSISPLKGIFNLLGIWVYSDINNLVNMILFSLLLVFISSICLFFTYKNKEGVIIYGEK